MKQLKLITILLFSALASAQSGNKLVEKMIQKSIDSKEISIYFHENQKDRKPLIILDNAKILNEIKLTKFNAPVKIFTEEQILKQNIKAFITVKSIVTEKEYASLVLEYKIEGMEAKVEFQKKNHKWEISNINVWEN